MDIGNIIDRNTVDVVTIDISWSLQAAAALMMRNRVAALIVTDLHLDPRCTGVAEGVAERLAGNAVDLVLDDRRQIARRALDVDMERRPL